MGLCSGGIIIGRIFVSGTWGAYFWEGFIIIIIIFIFFFWGGAYWNFKVIPTATQVKFEGPSAQD